MQLCQLGKNKDGIQRGVPIWEAAIKSILRIMQVSWPDDIIWEVATLAYSEAYFLTHPEFAFFCYRAKTGFYQSHKNITPPIFLSFVRDYATEVHNARPDVYAHDKKPLIKSPPRLHYSKLSNPKSRSVAKWILSQPELCHFLQIASEYRASIAMSRLRAVAQEIEDNFGIEKQERVERERTVESTKLKCELIFIRIGIQNNKFSAEELQNKHNRIKELEELIKQL